MARLVSPEPEPLGGKPPPLPPAVPRPLPRPFFGLAAASAASTLATGSTATTRLATTTTPSSTCATGATGATGSTTLQLQLATATPASTPSNLAGYNSSLSLPFAVSFSLSCFLLIYASSRCCWSVVDIVVITTQQSTINVPLVVVLQVALQAVVIDGRCWVDDEIGEPGMQVVNEITLLEGGAANPT